MEIRDIIFVRDIAELMAIFSTVIIFSGGKEVFRGNRYQIPNAMLSACMSKFNVTTDGGNITYKIYL